MGVDLGLIGTLASDGKHCGGCGAVGFTSGVGMIDPSLVSLDGGVGSGRKLFLTLINILSRRSWMDLSKGNSIAAARCESRPDEELRTISGTNPLSTEGFSFD